MGKSGCGCGREEKEGKEPSEAETQHSGTDQVQPSVVARPSRWTVSVLAAQVLPTRARRSQQAGKGRKRQEKAPAGPFLEVLSAAVCWRL
jgi:hypothetical protein